MSGMPVIRADWPAPKSVQALITTRAGGVSVGQYAALNLGDHVGDDPRAVSDSRARLRKDLGLPADPVWLTQVHGTAVVDAGAAGAGASADASFATRPGIVCAVLTADCLPVFLCDRAGTRVGIAHAGWRGLAAGVIESTVAALGAPYGELMAWLGPAIGPDAFEVGPEVRAAFVDRDAGAACAFQTGRAGHWFADIYQLARRRLHALGVHAVHGGDLCTFTDSARFYSYRRDGTCGRMASLIWMTPTGL
jgi:YfiH family protein